MVVVQNDIILFRRAGLTHKENKYKRGKQQTVVTVSIEIQTHVWVSFHIMIISILLLTPILRLVLNRS